MHDVEGIYSYTEQYVIVVMKNGSSDIVLVSDPKVVEWKKAHKIIPFKFKKGA